MVRNILKEILLSWGKRIIKVKNMNKQTDKIKCVRHGEVALCRIDKLPEGLTPSKEKVFMVGSHGNNHSIDNGTLYFKKEGEFVFGYLKAKNTNLLHPEHKDKSGKASIEDGFYELRKQQEWVADGLKPIVD